MQREYALAKSTSSPWPLAYRMSSLRSKVRSTLPAMHQGKPWILATEPWQKCSMPHCESSLNHRSGPIRFFVTGQIRQFGYFDKKNKAETFSDLSRPTARAVNSCDFHTHTLQMPAIYEYLSLSFHSVLLGLFVSLKNHLKSGVSFHFHWPSRPCLRSWRHFWGKFAYLQEPLPTPLNALRSTIYSSLVPMANAQNLSWSWMLMASIQRDHQWLGVMITCRFFCLKQSPLWSEEYCRMHFHAFSTSTRVKSLWGFSRFIILNFHVFVAEPSFTLWDSDCALRRQTIECCSHELALVPLFCA